MSKMSCLRVSQYFDRHNKEKPPCEEAEFMPYVHIDRIHIDDTALAPINHPGLDQWYSEGRNHRVDNGTLARDRDKSRWYVTIDSLDELNAFISKYGKVVLSKDEECLENSMVIEIYDDYRE